MWTGIKSEFWSSSLYHRLTLESIHIRSHPHTFNRNACNDCKYATVQVFVVALQQRHCITNVIHNTESDSMGATKQLYTATTLMQ